MALSKSQRIKLLVEIADRLSENDWAIIDLTLSQFDLPTQEVWNNTQKSYVLAMVKSADDESVIGLAQHLEIPLEDEFPSPTSPDAHPSFWKPDSFRLFISHLATHRKFAAALQESLDRYGISSFVAHNDIEPTKEWQTEIEVALSSCDGLVALLHNNFHESNWTDQELGFAMGRGVPILTVGLGENPYGFIGKFQAFNGASKKSWELARELFDAIRKNKKTQEQMAEILVRLFEESPSFDAAKARIGYLEELEIWKPSFASRIQSASDSNGQIESAWGVQDRVNALVKKWKK